MRRVYVKIRGKLAMFECDSDELSNADLIQYVKNDLFESGVVQSIERVGTVLIVIDGGKN